MSPTPGETSPAALLQIRDLTVGFPTVSTVAHVVRDLSLTVAEREIVGLVGESGSGKSVTCRAIIGLVPQPGAVLAGQVLLGGRDVLRVGPRELRRIRGNEIAMVFQDPMSSLNPVFTVGHQLVEVLIEHGDLSRRNARERAVELLDRVGIPAPKRRMKAYPHELSGGMRQRVMIAIALSGRPRLLLADEPTTALDVTIQDQILVLLREIRDETGMAIVLVSHDMGVIAQTCDRVAVMYAGRLVEVAPIDELYARPQHPYTRALLDAIPRIDGGRGRGELRVIAGQPPDVRELAGGCPFAPRCSFVRDACADVTMELLPVTPVHLTACPFVGADDPVPAPSTSSTAG
jgi:peptide/nickel transport system ATP-binding protein/oligopeptide transport system ATP-binding protein